MENENKKLNLKIIIPVIVAIVVIVIIFILAKNTKTIVIQTPNSTKYTISGEIIEFHDIEQSIVSYQRQLLILAQSESNRYIADWEEPTYSFTDLKTMFEADYEKICKIYDKAYKQVEDNVKITIPMKNYKESLDIIHEGIINGELYEGCDNEKYIKALEELGTAGTDFIMQFINDYME